jgi:hypothetical protein
MHLDMHLAEEETFLMQLFEASRRRFKQRARLHQDGSWQAAGVEGP